jgi:hypothetical protein
MPLHLAQEAPQQPTISLDFGGIGDAIWASFLAHMNDVGTAIWADLSQWLYGLLRGLLVGLWHATLLPIPHDVTDQFGPVQAMMPSPGAIAAAGITLSLSLLGVRVILRAVPFDHQPAADFLLGRLVAWGALLALLPWMIEHSIDVQQELAAAVVNAGFVGIDELLPAAATPNPFALVILLVLGLRLMVKLASNVVHIAISIVWSPVALVLGLIPATSYIGSMWLHEFFGRLAGGVLATIAATLGLSLALINGGSDFAIFGAAGAMVAAYDLVDWLARTPGSSPAGVVGGMVRTAAAATMGLGAGAALIGGGAAAATGGGQGAASLGAGGALPAGRSLAPQFSYD